jgi:hypothetical protein
MFMDVLPRFGVAPRNPAVPAVWAHAMMARAVHGSTGSDFPSKLKHCFRPPSTGFRRRAGRRGRLSRTLVEHKAARERALSARKSLKE